jgi:5-methylcytosine-specific restriction endonuclease McrA
MIIELPEVIHVQPNLKDYKNLYGNKFETKIIFKVAVKIWLRTVVSEAQNHKCCWCGRDTITKPNKSNSATLEHIIPRANGGTDDLDNLAMSCNKCNGKRGILPPEEFMAIISHNTQMAMAA